MTTSVQRSEEPFLSATRYLLYAIELRNNNGTTMEIIAKLNDGMLPQHVEEKPDGSCRSAEHWKNHETTPAPSSFPGLGQHSWIEVRQRSIL